VTVAAGHLIERSDVDAWLAGATFGSLMRHGTTPEGEAGLRARGVDVELMLPGNFGTGFYCVSAASSYDPARHGGRIVDVVVRLEHPVFCTPTEAEAIIDEYELRAFADDDVREAWQAQARARELMLADQMQGFVFGDGLMAVIFDPACVRIVSV
jgi:hypothetical protein